MVLKKKVRILKIILSFLRRVNPHLFHLQVEIPLWTSWLGPELSVAWSTGAQLIIFFCLRFSVVLFDGPGISIRHAAHCMTDSLTS